jgi:hypothetical protein
MPGTPEYELGVQENNLVLTILLPGVHDSSALTDMQLHINQSTSNQTQLNFTDGKGLYDLTVVLPHTVDENKSKAKFSRKKKQIVVTIPVCSGNVCSTSNHSDSTCPTADSSADDNANNKNTHVRDLAHILATWSHHFMVQLIGLEVDSPLLNPLLRPLKQSEPQKKEFTGE